MTSLVGVKRKALAAAVSQPSPAPVPPAPGLEVKRRNTQLPRSSERDIPERLDVNVAESPLVRQLQQFEQMLDGVIANKHAKVQEALNNQPRQPHILRLYFFNEYANQPPAPPKAGEPPSWTFRIIGQILDTQRNLSTRSTLRFSELFSRIVVQLDEKVYPGLHSTIEWDKAVAPSAVGGLEIKRLGTQPCSVLVTMHMQYTPPRYKVSTALGSLIAAELETRPCIIASIWQYIKRNYLQNPADPTKIRCDELMRKVFEQDVVSVDELLSHLDRHLSPPDPFVFKYDIKLTGDPQAHIEAWDINFPLPEIVHPMVQHPGKPPTAINVREHTEQILEAMKRIDTMRRRREFYLTLSANPAAAINMLIASKVRDIRQRGPSGHFAEEEKRAAYYQQDWVMDAIDRYLQKREREEEAARQASALLPVPSSGGGLSGGGGGGGSGVHGGGGGGGGGLDQSAYPGSTTLMGAAAAYQQPMFSHVQGMAAQSFTPQSLLSSSGGGGGGGGMGGGMTGMPGGVAGSGGGGGVSGGGVSGGGAEMQWGISAAARQQQQHQAQQLLQQQLQHQQQLQQQQLGGGGGAGGGGASLAALGGRYQPQSGSAFPPVRSQQPLFTSSVSALQNPMQQQQQHMSHLQPQLMQQAGQSGVPTSSAGLQQLQQLHAGLPSGVASLGNAFNPNFPQQQ